MYVWSWRIQLVSVQCVPDTPNYQELLQLPILLHFICQVDCFSKILLVTKIGTFKIVGFK